MDKISYLGIYAKYFDIDTIIDIAGAIYHDIV